MPLIPPASAPPALFWDEQMREHHIERFYGGSGYFNFGLGPATLPQREACQALVDDLLSRIARAPRAALDVACGNGATTARLRQRFPAALIVGVNISRAQLERARATPSSATLSFVCGDATALPFASGGLDALVAVEAAFSFRTRAAFLGEASRLLARGGRLVLSDVLATAIAARYTPQSHPANYVASPDAYAALLREHGFVDVQIEDVKARAWDTFLVRKRAFNDALLDAGDTSREEHARNARTLALWNQHITHYVLASGTAR